MARLLWACTVWTTSARYDIAAMGQLYRERCDCENGFDELKNPWGWGGLTTQDMHRSELTARAVARVYNGWSGYLRAYNFWCSSSSHSTRTALRLKDLDTEYIADTWASEHTKKTFSKPSRQTDAVIKIHAKV